MRRSARERAAPLIQIPSPLPGASAYLLGECSVLVGIEAGRWHLSIACRDRYPTWDEIAEARYRLVPDAVTMAMLLPPQEDYVNVHECCFHLWEVRDPEFVRHAGRIIVAR